MDKLKKLFDMSEKIILAYADLMFFNEDICDNDIQSDIIDNIRDLVIEEYNLMQKITMDEVNDYMEIINSYETNNEWVLSRVKNKLIECKELLNNNFITSKELGITSIPEEIKFSIYDAIMSLITIDTIKYLTKKIYFSNPKCEKDKIFIDTLKNKLETFKVNFLFDNSLSELLALSNEINVNKMPVINVDNIKNKINRLDNNNFNMVIESIAFYYSKNAIDSLTEIIKIFDYNPRLDIVVVDDNLYYYNNVRLFIDIVKNCRNNPKYIFSYLTLTTQLEVLSWYLSDDMVKSVEKYFSDKVSNFNNGIIVGYVKKLIRSKKN